MTYLPLLAVALFTYLIYRICKSIDLRAEYDEARHERWALSSVILEAMYYAEEQAYKAKRADRSPLSGEEKLAIAVQYAEDALLEHSVYGVSRSFIEKSIEANLPDNRIRTERTAQ